MRRMKTRNTTSSASFLVAFYLFDVVFYLFDVAFYLFDVAFYLFDVAFYLFDVAFYLSHDSSDRLFGVLKSVSSIYCGSIDYRLGVIRKLQSVRDLVYL